MNVEDKRIILDRDDLEKIGIRVSNTTLLRWELQGRFPRRLRPGLTTVGWLAVEIEAWVAAQASDRQRHVYAEY